MIPEMFDHMMFTFGNAVLKSGKTSPIYVNLRKLPSFPTLMREVSEALLRKIHSEQFLGTKLVGLPMSGLPIASVMGVIGNMPVLYPRQTGYMNVEGFYRQGEDVIVIDDVLSDGEIKKIQIEAIRRSGLEVRDLLVVVDREEGGSKMLEDQLKIRTHSLFKLDEVVEILRNQCNLCDYEYARYQQYRKTR